MSSALKIFGATVVLPDPPVMSPVSSVTAASVPAPYVPLMAPGPYPLQYNPDCTILTMFRFVSPGPMLPCALSAVSVPGPNESESVVMPSSCCRARISAYIVGHPVRPFSGAGVKPATLP